MKYNFNQKIDRRDSESVKWNRYEEDILPMWVADMDFQCPSPILDALQNRIKHGVFGYPELQDTTRKTVIDWLWKQYRWSVSEDELLFLPGVVNGFNLATHALTVSGEGVIVQTPTYRPFLEVAENTGCEQHSMTLDRSSQGHYHITKTTFENCIQGNSRMFMLCNPQNPTGRVFSQQELEMMAELCLENDIYICSDEIHCDIVYGDKKHIPIATLSPRVEQSTITLLSPSKTFNIAGLKAAVAVVKNPEIKENLLQARQGLVGWVNVFGQLALRTAYQSCTPWLQDLLSYLEQNRRITDDFVRSNLPGVTMSLPDATYLAWLDCRQTGLEDPQQFFLKEARVALNKGHWFGADGQGFVRLNFGCPQSQLIEGLERMESALEGHEPPS